MDGPTIPSKNQQPDVGLILLFCFPQKKDKHGRFQRRRGRRRSQPGRRRRARTGRGRPPQRSRRRDHRQAAEVSLFYPRDAQNFPLQPAARIPPGLFGPPEGEPRRRNHVPYNVCTGFDDGVGAGRLGGRGPSGGDRRVPGAVLPWPVSKIRRPKTFRYDDFAFR